MHEAFATIEFGPFATSYHRQTVDERFRETLSDYLERELLPQVEEAYDRTKGTLVALFNEERFCGPRSAVRDLYKLDFSFVREASEDTISAELIWDAKRGQFHLRQRSGRLILSTARRRAEYRTFCEAIQMIVDRIQAGESEEWRCPKCDAALAVTDRSDLFVVKCPRMCFDFNYHRAPKSGEFLHGHFFTSPEPRPQGRVEPSSEGGRRKR